MNPGPVLSLDKDGKVLMANSAAAAVFKQPEPVGKSWFELCPQITKRLWQEIISCKTVYPVEALIDDKYLLLSHVCTENLESVYVFGADITVNKINEKKLAAQKSALEELARIPDMNPGPVLRLDLEANVLLSNSAAKSLFGSDIVGNNWKKVCSVMNNKLWKDITKSKEAFPVEARIGDKEFIFYHRRDFISNMIFVFGTDVTLQKLTEKSLHQAEKMATLGTLAAGVAHELNNPASATKRAAQQLNDTLGKLENAQKKFSGHNLTGEERKPFFDLVTRSLEEAALKKEADIITHSDNEYLLEQWLEENGVKEPWNIAPILNDQGIDVETLRKICSEFKHEAIADAVEWLAYSLLIHPLISEIIESTSRISEIVIALKNYSFLGQAPIQQVNIHEGINNTLIILKNKLKSGINVIKDYSEDVPLITAYGSELNQVWTNIIDNAIDAMNGKGEITIRTRKNKNSVSVEIEDNGPGIPVEVQSRIFDPFFTTKEPGKGTGLGLSTSYGIITEKHKGKLKVQSQNGTTRFTVVLPINHEV